MKNIRIFSLISFVIFSTEIAAKDKVVLSVGSMQCESVMGNKFRSEKRPFVNRVGMAAYFSRKYFVDLNYVDCGTDETYFIEKGRRYVDPITGLTVIGEVEERSVENMRRLNLGFGYADSLMAISYSVALGVGVMNFDKHHFRSSITKDWQSSNRTDYFLSSDLGGFIHVLDRVQLGVDVALLTLPSTKRFFATYGFTAGIQW